MITMYKWDNPALQQIWKRLYAHNTYVFPILHGNIMSKYTNISK